VEEPLIEWDGSREISFGQGWIAVTPIQSTHSPIGVFVNDSALTQSALDAVKQDVVAVFCSILGNIVERMQAEEVIRESEQKLKNALAELEKTYKQLQELDKMKSDFISIVSHELRTPLTSIKSSANILLKGGPQKHPIDERELELLNIIINNTDRQTRMINNLLDISKIEAGVLDMQMEPVDIVNVARDVVGTFQSQTQDKVITLHAFVSEKPLMVLADYEHIRRVFTNLIDNAIKFTPDKGKVSVKIEELGQEIRVIVSDTGIGISKNDALKIFNKFQRLNDSRVRKLGGTGLGLVIAKSIVEAHGGKIWPDSDPGQGASFYFTLPIHSDEAAEIIHRSVTISSMNQKRILIVDDEPDIVTTIKVVLEQEGYNTLCARDGKEALQKARQELPDLMILDLKLPLLSGEEVCRRIRKDEIIGKLPIIMLTAKDSDVDRVLGKVIGANHYIAKPFDVQRLLNVVSKIFKDYAGR